MKSIHVAAAVIQNGDKILAAQRGYGEFRGGWEFPGGKLEPDESAEDACIREIQEEMRVTVAIEDKLCTVDYDYPTFHITMDCFWCTIPKGTIHDTEHDDLTWLSKDELWSLDWLPADIDAVKQIEARLQA